MRNSTSSQPRNKKQKHTTQNSLFTNVSKLKHWTIQEYYAIKTGNRMATNTHNLFSLNYTRFKHITKLKNHTFQSELIY